MTLRKGFTQSEVGLALHMGSPKLALTTLTRIMARNLTKERPGDEILCNACCPGWVRTDMAGPNATKSPDEGAVTPVYLALLPAGAKEPHGQFVSEKKVQPWWELERVIVYMFVLQSWSQVQKHQSDPSRFRQAISRKLWAEFRLSPWQKTSGIPKSYNGHCVLYFSKYYTKSFQIDQSFGE